MNLRHGALLLLLTLFTLTAGTALAQDGVVRGILFYSPDCPHCHETIEKDLPPILEKYGDKLQLVVANILTEDGEELLKKAIERFNIPPQRQGVPTLIVGDRVLVGPPEIREHLPKLIESYLDQGGIGWPDVPGLQETLLQKPSNASGAVEGSSSVLKESNSVEKGTTSGDATLGDRFMRDPAGNTLASVVLVGMIASLISVARPAVWKKRSWGNPTYRWVLPLLCLLGLGVASYLAYVEMSHSLAVCGPVGNCNAVQQSPYARVFGIPVGVLGIVGYMAMLGVLALWRWGDAELVELAPAGIFLMALAGTLFSAYLTFLEPFVIGATCMWCLTSAVTMTLILLLSAGPGWQALRKIPVA